VNFHYTFSFLFLLHVQIKQKSNISTIEKDDHKSYRSWSQSYKMKEIPKRQNSPLKITFFNLHLRQVDTNQGTLGYSEKFLGCHAAIYRGS
jgi:hypothetical protein